MKVTLSEIYKAMIEQEVPINFNNTIHSLEYCKTEIELKDKDYMKTSEFKSELEKLGYVFEDSCVTDKDNFAVAWISALYVNVINSNHVCGVSPKLFNLIYKYAATPIAEREDEDDSIIYTGAELIRTAVDDWADFSEGDEKLMDWFPELADLLPKKKYKTDPQLMCIEEVEEND